MHKRNATIISYVECGLKYQHLQSKYFLHGFEASELQIVYVKCVVRMHFYYHCECHHLFIYYLKISTDSPLATIISRLFASLSINVQTDSTHFNFYDLVNCCSIKRFSQI